MNFSKLPALVLVCKRPRLGHGKQRLAKRLGAETTLRVAEALLACAVEDANHWPGQVIFAPACPGDFDWAVALAKPLQLPVKVVPQESGNLGQRINALDQILRRQGAKQLLYIGSDAPELGMADYSSALAALQQSNTVFKPAADGGVVLMASNYPWPYLHDLPWSSNQLGVELAERCRLAGHSVKTLVKSHDVDEPDDIMRLTHQLAKDQRPARRTLYKLACQIFPPMKTANA